MLKGFLLTGLFFSTTASFAVCPDRKAELKAAILNIATENSANTIAELPVTREKLEPLVQELVALNKGEPNVDEQLTLVEGTWKEIWSDDREPERPGSKLLRDTIYQVVSAQGYFYNIAVSQTQIPNGPLVENTSFLRGRYSLDAESNGLRIQFTDIGYLPGRIGSGFLGYIDQAESDPNFLKKFPFDLKAPKGPINQTGLLKNVYVDEELRIARGVADLDGIPDLLVLTRADEAGSSN